MIKRVKRACLALLLCTLSLSAYVAWSGITGRELPWPIPGGLGGGEHIVGSDSHFDDLDVTRGGDGLFDGTISVENPTDGFQDVYVTVDLFDGEQNVGELAGNVTLKPGSASSLDLVSSDTHATWSDAHVDLLRLPS